MTKSSGTPWRYSTRRSSRAASWRIADFLRLDRTFGGDTHVFYQIYSPTGTLLYSTFLGASSLDYCRFVALDAQDRPVLATETRNADFPTTSGAYDRIHNGGGDIAITRLNVSFRP